MGPDETYDPTEGNLPPTEFPADEEAVEQTPKDLGETEEDLQAWFEHQSEMTEEDDE